MNAETEPGSDAHHVYLEAIGKVYFYVYASEATRPFDSEELQELLAKSRRHNAALGVSGMLLYQNGCFLQVLEGPRAAVHAVLEKIVRDPRHRAVVKLVDGFENEYQFSDWSMGFHDLESAEAKATAGYSYFLDQPVTVKALALDPPLAQRILMTFKKMA